MTLKIYISIFLIIFTLSCKAQRDTSYLTKEDVASDLAYLDEILQNNSSYQALNGYEYKNDFSTFLKNFKERTVTKYDFELFLSKTIGKIGDRHAYVRGDRIRDSLFFPMAFAPFDKRVLVLDYNSSKKQYDFWNPDFPYLKSIHNIPIEKLLPKIFPGEALAPAQTYLTSVVRELRDIQKIFKSQNIDLPNPINLALVNELGVEKEVRVELAPRKRRARYWDERFYRNIYRLKEEQYNDTVLVKRFFSLENRIGYIQVAEMVEKEECPIFFKFLNDFMIKARQSDALIVDLRDNDGGTRELIQEFAGYFVHPDSVHIVNTTRQRGKLPLNKELKEALHDRFLFSRDELDSREQQAVDTFMGSFAPMYDLDDKKFSEYYFYTFNGQKRPGNKYHYDKPIYILTNERSFSAASIFVSVFKGLPNIQIVGVNTDGSSGNSERFELPNTKLRGKISTMVSYQKDGAILDGIGTKPDLLIERNLDQIFWKEDYQLTELIKKIRNE